MCCLPVISRETGSRLFNSPVKRCRINSVR
nr:MAG TPA: hypothetical protein [Crassvirales sp.]